MSRLQEHGLLPHLPSCDCTHTSRKLCQSTPPSERGYHTFLAWRKKTSSPLHRKQKIWRTFCILWKKSKIREPLMLRRRWKSGERSILSAPHLKVIFGLFINTIHFLTNFYFKSYWRADRDAFIYHLPSCKTTDIATINISVCRGREVGWWDQESCCRWGSCWWGIPWFKTRRRGTATRASWQVVEWGCRPCTLLAWRMSLRQQVITENY